MFYFTQYGRNDKDNKRNKQDQKTWFYQMLALLSMQDNR